MGKKDENNFEDGVLTFDEILADKTYQAEFDRRVQKAITTATERVTTQYEDTIKSLKEELGLSKEQLEKLGDYEAKQKEAQAQYEKELADERKKHAFEMAVAKSGVIDDVALKAHLKEFYDTAEFKDGAITGLEEQINKRLEDDLQHLRPSDKKALGGTFKPTNPSQTLEDEVMKAFKIKE